MSTSTSTSTSTVGRDYIMQAMARAGLTTLGTVNDTYLPATGPATLCLSFVISGTWTQRRLCQFMVFLGILAGELFERTDSIDGFNIAYGLSEVVCTDHRGPDTIVYFPGWKLA